MDKYYDVIVIGGGVGGLSAATRTSKEGAKTLLLEAMSQVGGYINPYKINNFVFDTGLHYLGELGENGSLKRRLENLGIYEKLEFIEINPKCIGKYYINGEVFCLPKGIDNFKENILKLLPHERKATDKLIKLLLVIKEATTVALKGPKHPKFIKFLPRLIKLSKKPYGKLIDEITKNKRLKYLFSLMSGEVGLPPDKASPFIMASVLLHYIEGAYYPKGGSKAIKNAFINTIEKNKGEIKTSHRVKKISKEKGVFKVDTDNGTFYSKSVISNADPKITFTKLIDEKINSKKLRKKAENAKPSLGAFYAFLVTDLELEKFGLSDSNLIHADTLDLNESFEKWDEFKTFFITIPTLKDPEGYHAPNGLHTIEIISIAPFDPFKKWVKGIPRKRGKNYMELKNNLGEKLLSKVEKYIPELKNHIIFKDFATPLSNLYWVNAPNGGNYGPSQTPNQTGPNRFPIKTEIEGLYLCGAGTIAGGIAPSIASGDIAGQTAIKHIK